MKKVEKYNVGDKVFAKIKGYPAWPATITEDLNSKYNVIFYGTGETASVKSKDLFYYLKYKSTFVKSLKRKDYNEAIEEIEKAIEQAGTDGNSEEGAADFSKTTELSDSIDSTKTNKRKRSSIGEKIHNLKKKHTMSVDDNNLDESSQSTELHTSPATTANEESNESAKNKITNEATAKESEGTADSTENSEEPLKENHDATRKSYGNNSEIRDDSVTTTTADNDIYKLKIITSQYLQALSSYAQHVHNNKEVFSNIPAVSRQNLFNEVVLAKLPNDHFVALKYNRSLSTTFKNEYLRVEHDEAESERVLSKKKLIENGLLKVEDELELFEPGVELNNDQIEHMLELDLVNRKKAKLKLLRRESTLIALDGKIKGSLGLDKADPKTALEHLSKMAEMVIEPLMLKKHPHIVDMVKRLRRYIGNVKEWGMNEEQQEQFDVEAESVREKAEEVYVNFAKLFGVTDTSEFWDVFSKEVDSFKQQVKDLKESEIFTLTAEPNTRDAFIEKIDDEYEVQIDLGKLDKNNSSTVRSTN